MHNLEGIGDQKHRQLLSLLIALFSKYPEITLFGVYGSLTTGKWDKYSDYDLVVVSDNVDDGHIQTYVDDIQNVLRENRTEVYICNDEGNNKWAFVLENLDRINITFSKTPQVNSYVLDSLVTLFGTLSKEDLEGSISPNNQSNTSLDFLHKRFFDLAINVQIAIQRNQRINTLAELNELRELVSETYRHARRTVNAPRTDSKIDADLKEILSPTYTQGDLADIKKSFDTLIDIYLTKLPFISNNKIELKEKYKILADKIKNY